MCIIWMTLCYFFFKSFFFIWEYLGMSQLANQNLVFQSAV